MKGKKKITEAVLAANRGNAKLSTGPKTEQGKSKTCQNALRHGILSKRIVLKNDKDRSEFQALLQSWNTDRSPEGLVEELLVDEAVIIAWRLQTLEGLITRELSIREDVTDQLDGVFLGQLKLPISSWDLPLDRGWDCERIVVRAIAAKDESNSSGSRAPAVFQNVVLKEVQKTGNHTSEEGGHLEVEATLGNSLANMTRYQRMLKSDLYKAIKTLSDVQAERRNRERRVHKGGGTSTKQSH